MTKPHFKTPEQLKLAVNVVRSMRSVLNNISGGQNYADQKHDKAWTDYGWPDKVEFFMLWNFFRRNAAAAAVVTLPIKYCWLTLPTVAESDDPKNPTEYDKKFEAFANRLKLWQRVKGADLRQRVGRYSGLVWTVADSKKMSEPLERVSADKVVNVRPVYEGQLEPSTYDQDEQSPRFGMPITYSVNYADVGGRDDQNNLTGTIHYTRVTIFAEGADDGTIYGISCLENILNDLIDYDKIAGGGGEGFWRAAAQKFVIQAKKGQEGQTPSPAEITQLSAQIAAMMAGFDAQPFIGGHELAPIGTNLPDPKSSAEITEKRIAAGSGYPAKILFGTQTGVKAGDEDTDHFMRIMQSRRTNELSDMIGGVIDWLNEHTDLISVSASVRWDDLTAPNASKKMEFAKGMAGLNTQMITSGFGPVFSPAQIVEYLGFDPEDMPESDFPELDDEDEEDDVPAVAS